MADDLRIVDRADHGIVQRRLDAIRTGSSRSKQVGRRHSIRSRLFGIGLTSPLGEETIHSRTRIPGSKFPAYRLRARNSLADRPQYYAVLGFFHDNLPTGRQPMSTTQLRGETHPSIRHDVNV